MVIQFKFMAESKKLSLQEFQDVLNLWLERNNVKRVNRWQFMTIGQGDPLMILELPSIPESNRGNLEVKGDTLIIKADKSAKGDGV